MAGEASYAAGNCTWYVAHELSWVHGGWGNAYQWADRAQREGFSLAANPVAGSVVVYAPGFGYSELGHVAIVEALLPGSLFIVREMNAVGLGVVSKRISNKYGVYAFILPPVSALAGNLAVPGIPPSPALDRVAWAWANLSDFLSRVWPAQVDNLALLASQLRGIN